MFHDLPRSPWIALTFSCLFSIIVATDVAAQVAASPPDSVVLYGVVRDFTKDHPDFDVDPIDGLGHYAGNIDLSLGSDNRPDFNGGGIKVATQWRDTATQPIAPHLFADGGSAGVIKVVDAPSVHGNSTFDTRDSSVGPYGGANVGPAPTFEVGATMPGITLPTGMGATVGDVTWGNETVSADLHCDDLTVNGLAQISGNVTILCEGSFTMATHSDLELQPGSTLLLYVMDDITIMPHSNLNANTGMPGLVTIYYSGTDEVRISQPLGVVYAAIVTPFARMRVMPNAEFYGTFIGKASR